MEDCTGCGLCVEACPVSAPGDPDRQAINLAPREPLLAGGAGEHRVLRDAAGQRSVPGGLRHRPRHPVPAAAVRVLRRLRRLRRDAVPEAAVPAVRRPADDRERDRLLLDLRRQPADHPVDDRRGRARPGLVELAVRGQRRVRARASGWPPTCTCGWPGPGWPSCATRSGRTWSTRSWPRRSGASRSSPRSAAGSPSCSRRLDGAGRADRGRRRDLRSVLDHLVRRSVWLVGGRRLGLRHRLGRARPRAGQRPRRQRAGAGHRGVLQHRRADVQGHPARRGRQVRRGRQDRAQEGPGAAGDRVRQRVRRAGGDGRRPAADAARAARGRGVRRALAGHRLQPLHRARHRDAQGDGPAVPRGGQRLLAADPLRPGAARRGRQPVPARLAAAPDPAGRLHQPGAAVPDPGRTPTRPRPSGCRAWPSRRSTSAGPPTRRWPRRGPNGSRPTRAGPARQREDADGPHHRRTWAWTLRNPLVASASPLSQTVDGRPAAGRRRCRRGRPAIAVRGGAAPRGRRRTRGWSRPGRTASPSRCRYLPAPADARPARAAT